MEEEHFVEHRLAYQEEDTKEDQLEGEELKLAIEEGILVVEQ